MTLDDIEIINILNGYEKIKERATEIMEAHHKRYKQGYGSCDLIEVDLKWNDPNLIDITYEIFSHGETYGGNGVTLPISIFNGDYIAYWNKQDKVKADKEAAQKQKEASEHSARLEREAAEREAKLHKLYLELHERYGGH